MIDALSNKFIAYYDDIPSDAIKVTTQSVIFTFSYSFLLNAKLSTDSLNITRPLFNAGVAGLASFIYALTTPFFKLAFGNEEHHLHQEFVKYLINGLITTVIVSASKMGKVDIAALPFLKIVPFHLFKACFNLIPSLFELFGDTRSAQESKRDLLSWGLYAEPGSTSLHIVL